MPTKKPKQLESTAQTALINYLKLKYKDALYCASAGGLHTSKTQGIKMKQMGYIAGHPDLAIYEPRNGYVGLMIEMKAEGGVLRPNQKEWIAELEKRGWKAVCCYGFDEARAVVDWYFEN